MRERYRWPWYWLVVLAVLVLAGTVGIVASANSRVHATEQTFAGAQMLRAQRLARRLDDYFASAKRLTVLAARYARRSGDPSLVRPFLGDLFMARLDSNVYGVGVFYAPYAVDSSNRLVNFYDHEASRPPGSRFARSRGNRVEIRYYGPGTGADNYVASPWYRTAVALHGIVGYYGPYKDSGISYVSVVQAFYRDGKLYGVATADALLERFRDMLVSVVGPGDVAWISVPRSGVVLATGPLPPASPRYRDIGLRLTYSHATVHVTSDTSPLAQARRDTYTAAALSVSVLWLLAVITGIGLIQRWRAREATVSLEIEQERLEGEIAIARRIESELRRAAFTDTLTGLPNRAALTDALAGDLDARSGGDRAVFLIDLDHFNITNETLGHPAGDELLRVISAQLQAALGGNALLARLGGDEFAVLSACSRETVDEFAVHILAAIAAPVVLFGRTVYPQASIGIAFTARDYAQPQDVLRDAEIAMYAAKARGRARHAVFDEEMRLQVARDSELELHLRRAIEQGDIVPHYQPIVDLRSRRIVSFEALARWQRDRELVTAAAFVPFAESRGFVHQIDAAILRGTFAHAKAIFALFPDTTIAVNVSAPELTGRDYARDLKTLLAEHDLRPEQIRLEITETTMMTKTDDARATLGRLAEDGVSVVLDDFGTGYSSLAYLQRLSISGLKIDRSFVENIDTDERSREIVRSIVALAQSLNLTTIAEGVERASQVHELAILGVKDGQGFFFSDALAVTSLAALDIGDGRTPAARRME